MARPRRRHVFVALTLASLAACSSSGSASDAGADGGSCPSDLSQGCSQGATCESTEVGNEMCAIPFTCSCSAGRWQCKSAGNGQCQCSPFSLSLTTGTACNVPNLICTRSSMESGCTSNNDCTCDGAKFTCPPTCGPDGG